MSKSKSSTRIPDGRIQKANGIAENALPQHDILEKSGVGFSGSEATTEQVSPTYPATNSEPSLIIPKWYKPFQRRELKKKLVKQYLDEYAMPVKLADGKMYAPSQEEIRQYGSLLRTRNIKELKQIGIFRHRNLKLDPLDRLKSIDKKKYAVVTIFNDNNTTDTGVAHIDTRHFSRHGCLYLIVNGRGYYDPEFKMIHFYYFFNNPYPIEFKKGAMPVGTPDGKILSETIKFEILTALANIEMSKQINMILILSIIGRILEVAILLICLRGFKII